jgi:hypothetical protein
MKNLLLLLSAILATTGVLVHPEQAYANPPFYRVIEGENPGPKQHAIDRFTYGTDVLYTGDVKGTSPVRVHGTVWHSNTKEAKFFLGDSNPVLEQRDFMKLLEDNKWEEAKLLMQHVPDAFPRTENLAELLRDLRLLPANGAQLPEIVSALRARYPNGFFLKPVGGFNAAGTFPTEKSDFVTIHRGFTRDVKPKMEQLLKETGDATTVHLELMHLRHYSGRVIDDMLLRPETVIIQEKIRPAFGNSLKAGKAFEAVPIEYRVHVVEGRVLRGTTMSRWDDSRTMLPEETAAVERFSQRVVNRLPPGMRRMCFGMDVMKTENGLFQVIELNPGGESGYLYPETDVWIPQKLAERYHGKPTPLLAEFERFKQASTLASREQILQNLIKRPEMRALARDGGPITELLTRAKDVLMDDFRTNPSRLRAFELLPTLRKFRMEQFLRNSEIEELAGHLISGNSIKPGMALRLASVAGNLGLATGEYLFLDTVGKVRVLNGLNYDDMMVRDRLAALIGEEAKIQGVAGREGLTRIAEKIVDKRVVSAAELATNGKRAASITRDISRLTESASTRLVTSLSRSEMLSMVLKSLLKI